MNFNIEYLFIDVQQVSGWIAHDGATQITNGFFCLCHDLEVQSSEELIGFKILVVPIRRESNGLIGPNQAAKSVDVGRRRGHPLGLIDDQSGQKSSVLVQRSQVRDQLVIGKPVSPGPDYALRDVIQLR